MDGTILAYMQAIPGRCRMIVAAVRQHVASSCSRTVWRICAGHTRLCDFRMKQHVVLEKKNPVEDIIRFASLHRGVLGVAKERGQSTRL